MPAGAHSSAHQPAGRLRPPHALLWLAAWLGLAGCGGTGTSLLVVIARGPELTLKRLEVTVSFDERRSSRELDPAGPAEGELLVKLPDVARAVEVVAAGVDAAGVGLEARAQAMSVVGRRVEVRLALGGGFGDGGVTLVAGRLGGPGNADGVGGDARFNAPHGLAFDGAGQLYVADRLNHVVRRLELSTGRVALVAGKPGVAGTADGPPSLARFSEPATLAFDGAGALIVLDYATSTVRRVALDTQEVTTLAGSGEGSADGVARLARFKQPEGVCVLGGAAYVSDSRNYTLRRIDLTTLAVTTVAGVAGTTAAVDGIGAAARFVRPLGLACDPGGVVYVADRGGHAIRRFNVATGEVTTIAGALGTGGYKDGAAAEALFNGPAAVALDGAGALYVADSDNEAVRKVDLSTGAVTTLAGLPGSSGAFDGTGALARFRVPYGAAFAVTGGAAALYVSDREAHTVRRVSVDGEVITVAGAALSEGAADGDRQASRFLQPAGLAIDGEVAYVADQGNHVIRKIELATGTVSTLAGRAGSSGAIDGPGPVARFFSPVRVLADHQGRLYVSDLGNRAIRAIDLATSEVITIAGIKEMSGASDGPVALATFRGPDGLALVGKALYVADRENHTIRLIDLAAGTVSTVAGAAGVDGYADGVGGGARLAFPRDLAYDGAGALYFGEGTVTSARGHDIRKLDLATFAVSLVAGAPGTSGHADGRSGTARFFDPRTVRFDGGQLFVSDYGNHVLRRLDLTTGEVTTWAGTPGAGRVRLGALPGGLNGPFAIERLGAGRWLVAEQTENCVLGVPDPR